MFKIKEVLINVETVRENEEINELCTDELKEKLLLSIETDIKSELLKEIWLCQLLKNDDYKDNFEILMKQS